MLARTVLLSALLLACAIPAAAQGPRVFGYGAGVIPAGGSGLLIAASVERRPAGGGTHRRFDLVLAEHEQRDVFALASVVRRLGGPGSAAYALAGIGLFTGGGGLPLATTLGLGAEWSMLANAPVFIEGRVLYGSSVYYHRGSSFGVADHELIPSLSFGVKLAPR